MHIGQLYQREGFPICLPLLPLQLCCTHALPMAPGTSWPGWASVGSMLLEVTLCWVKASLTMHAFVG